MVRVLDSGLYGREFDIHTEHCSILKRRQFPSPQFSSVYSAVNACHHRWEGTCDGLVSRPGRSVQLWKPGPSTKPSGLPKAECLTDEWTLHGCSACAFTRGRVPGSDVCPVFLAAREAV